GSAEFPVTLTIYNSEGKAIEHVKGSALQSAWTKFPAPNPGNVPISYFRIEAQTPNHNVVGIDDLSSEAVSEEHGKEEHKESGGGSGGGSPPTPPSAKVTLLTPNPHAGEPLTLSGAGSQPGSGRII